MPLYVFNCTQGHETETLSPHSVTVISCACGEDAQRQSVYRTTVSIGGSVDWTPTVRDGGRVRTPVAERKTSLRQYDEVTSELAYHGSDAPLFAMAKQKADRLRRAGITDSLDMPK